MGKHRLIQSKPALYRLLICGIILRSLIAPGFMLDTGDQAPLGIGITLCNGPNGINTITKIALQHYRRGNSKIPGRHERSSDHFTATCDLWTASATFVGSPALDTDHLLAPHAHSEPFNYLPPHITEFFQYQHRPRAPPLNH
jgi:hypothetical protein